MLPIIEAAFLVCKRSLLPPRSGIYHLVFAAKNLKEPF